MGMAHHFQACFTALGNLLDSRVVGWAWPTTFGCGLLHLKIWWAVPTLLLRLIERYNVSMEDDS